MDCGIMATSYPGTLFSAMMLNQWNKTWCSLSNIKELSWRADHDPVINIIWHYEKLSNFSFFEAAAYNATEWLEFSLNDFLWVHWIQLIMTKSKSSVVTRGTTHLATDTLSVLVIQSVFSLLPLVRYQLPLTTLDRYQPRDGTGKLCFNTIVALSVCGYPQQRLEIWKVLNMLTNNSQFPNWQWMTQRQCVYVWSVSRTLEWLSQLAPMWESH